MKIRGNSLLYFTVGIWHLNVIYFFDNDISIFDKNWNEFCLFCGGNKTGVGGISTAQW